MIRDSTEPEGEEQQERLEREQHFHDQWAESVPAAQVLVDPMFSLPTCPENRFLLRRLGPLKNKRVLDLGTGLGEAAVFFAKQGAEVTAIDISPGMLVSCQNVARLHGVHVVTCVMSADKLSFPDNSFDIVYGANVLHHVETAQCLKDVRRVLRPDGMAVFYDPIRYNPAINVYRRMASEVRTADEHPLGIHDLRTMRELFPKVEHRFFWIASLLVFLKFYLIDRVHPNNERYWKKVLYDFDQISVLYRMLAAVDTVLVRIPVLQWWAWNVAIVCSVGRKNES